MTDRDDDLMRGRATRSGVPIVEDADAQPSVEAIRARQRSRATVMAWLLGAFVILIFAISIVKITQGHGP